MCYPLDIKFTPVAPPSDYVYTGFTTEWTETIVRLWTSIITKGAKCSVKLSAHFEHFVIEDILNSMSRSLLICVICARWYLSSMELVKGSTAHMPTMHITSTTATKCLRVLICMFCSLTHNCEAVFTA